jgi:hypothetical protein
MPPTTGTSTTPGSDRIDEVLDALMQLVQAVEARAGARPTEPDVELEQQRALFAYQWIAGHLGRADVVPPVIPVERRKGTLVFLTDPRGATHAFVVGEDGSSEEVPIADADRLQIPLSMRDDVPIAFVELRTERGAPVAVVHRVAGL